MFVPERPEFFQRLILPLDGYIRRLPHEYGPLDEEAYYSEVLKRLNIGPEDVVLDIGAGIGLDSLEIAQTYNPQIVYPLEPPGEDEEESENKFVLLRSLMEKDNIHNIEPIFGYAESLPLPDNSVTKLLMMHSAYAFTNLHQALSEARRVMANDSLGVLVTNGAADKLKFETMMQELGIELWSRAPSRVSHSLNYGQAFLELHEFFDVVDINNRKVDMQITEDTLPVYLWQFDSYRWDFNPPVLNNNDWERAKKSIVEDPIRAEMAANNGVFRDTIDISAIYFSHKR